jgi:5'-deoxynucleotidase YfbR-like HD superfamily hydrolase
MTVLNSGYVARYHAHRTIHKQTVAEHTWRMMVIYVQHFGSPPSHVWQYMLTHDSQEYVTGDIPFVIKRMYPELKSILQKIEYDVATTMGIPDIQLTDVEHWRVKIADLLEMKSFAEDEIAMGNTTAVDIIENINKALEQMEWSR